MNIFETTRPVFNAYDLTVMGDWEGRDAVRKLTDDELVEASKLDCVLKFGSDYRDEALVRFHTMVQREQERRS